jgi:hypothetical protein
MTAMAGGDVAQLVDFVGEFGAPLERIVRRTVFGFGRRDLLARRDEFEALVLTAGFALFDRASAWDPAGAPPWVWADRAIRAAIAEHVGHATCDFDAERADLCADHDVDRRGLEGSAIEVIDRLARFDDRAWLWWDAVASVATERDREVYFEYELQKALGDRSPAVTVATQTGLSTSNVRQIARRVRVRLAALIEDDTAFAELRAIEWLAA